MFVGRQFMSATVKELLKSDSICKSYVQIKRVQFFDSQCNYYRTTRVHSANYAVARSLSVCPSVTRRCSV